MAFTYIISFPFFLLFPLGIISLLKILETQLVPPEMTQSRGLLAAKIVASLQNRRYELSSAVRNIFLALLLTLLVLVSFIFTSMFGIITTSDIRPGASHVPLFYAPVTESDRWSRMVVFALFGVIFGGLRCIGWYFNYPTRSEQTLWRITITVIPLVVARSTQNKDIRFCPKFSISS
jgi:hypothetical protein